jgi:hypothetical protein
MRPERAIFNNAFGRQPRRFAVKKPIPAPTIAPNIGPTNGTGIAITAPIAAPTAARFTTGSSNIASILH